MKEYKYKVNGTNYTVTVGDVDGTQVYVEVNGTPYKVELPEKAASTVVKTAPRPAAAPRTSEGEKVVQKAAAPSTGGYQIKAPLPGTVLSIPVKVGDSVKASDTVLVLEAMKMENAIHAGRDGKVASINVNPGDAVPDGGLLITLE
ncbi:MAG: acetyl-CoA carboxylase biotin carboxyl carrier protein subunit [Muribaculaceae bacterium]|nr:acetyl-CoA carboxylase biotin carboxyl carrier protein subunit [Muribaculaceae bacterium]